MSANQYCSSKQKSSKRATKSTKAGSFIFMGTVFDVFPRDQISEVDGENRKGLFGQIDFWDSCVRYFTGRKKSDIRKTMLHEWIHMWVDWIRTETLSPTEQDIDQLADLVYTFFEDNQLWNDKAWRRVIPTEKDHG